MTLNLTWVVCPVDALVVGLRLEDAEGKRLPTELEVATEARRAAETRSRELEAAEARVRELEEELRRRG